MYSTMAFSGAEIGRMFWAFAARQNAPAIKKKTRTGIFISGEDSRRYGRQAKELDEWRECSFSLLQSSR